MPLEPLNYAPPPIESATARHSRIYTALLGGLAFFAIATMGMFAIIRSPTLPLETRWRIQMIVAIYALLIAAMVATLVLRGVAPRAGRIATMALNIILLIVFPVGTALGIYGLLKVDKADPPAGA